MDFFNSVSGQKIMSQRQGKIALISSSFAIVQQLPTLEMKSPPMQEG
jgi:hypothetical protein